VRRWGTTSSRAILGNLLLYFQTGAEWARTVPVRWQTETCPRHRQIGPAISRLVANYLPVPALAAAVDRQLATTPLQGSTSASDDSP